MSARSGFPRPSKAPDMKTSWNALTLERFGGSGRLCPRTRIGETIIRRAKSASHRRKTPFSERHWKTDRSKSCSRLGKPTGFIGNTRFVEARAGVKPALLKSGPKCAPPLGGSNVSIYQVKAHFWGSTAPFELPGLHLSSQGSI